MDEDPEHVDDDLGGMTPPDRPLPPPPTISELFAVCRERFALRHPRFDATRAVLAVAALVGLGGLCWVQFGPSRAPVATEPVPLASPSTVATPVASTSASTTTTPAALVVDVAGAVTHPGPVRVAPDARVADAIAAAGGPRPDADLERVDRAARLSDGQRVYVPRRGQTDIPEVVGAPDPASGGAAATGAPGTSTAADAATSGPVNLNTADLAALDTLPGVGPATAQAIIDHRTKNGPFRSVDQLLEVKGIGPAKFAELRARVTV